MTRDDWKVQNCANCGVELLGDSMRKFASVVHLTDRPAFVAGHIANRPYCEACLRERTPAEAGK